jgi:hypothetical protein
MNAMLLAWLIPTVVLVLVLIAHYAYGAFEDRAYGGMNGWGFTAVFGTAIVLMAALLLNALNATERSSCRREGNTSGYPWQYHGVGGCYLLIDGKYVPDSVWLHNTGN